MKLRALPARQIVCGVFRAQPALRWTDGVSHRAAMVEAGRLIPPVFSPKNALLKLTWCVSGLEPFELLQGSTQPPGRQGWGEPWCS